jgi:hypothetical protein
MQKIIFTASILFATIVFGFYLTACNNDSKNDRNQPLKIATTADSINYQCPMKDQGDTTYTAKGECPKCGMELELLK